MKTHLIPSRCLIVAMRSSQRRRPTWLEMNEAIWDHWVSCRNVALVIRARRPAWWAQLKIWLGRFGKGKS